MMNSDRRLNCDKLWRVWYMLFVTCLQCYMVYRGIARYLTFREKMLLPSLQQDFSCLNFYLAMIITSLTCFPLFIYCSLLRMNNYANDGVLIGRDTDNLLLIRTELSNAGMKAIGVSPARLSANSASATGREDVTETNSTGQPDHVISFWTRLRRHFLPFGCCLHIVSAYCLLIPLPVLDAEMINRGSKTADVNHASDLDFLFQSNRLGQNHQPGIPSVSAEFLNLVLALIILAYRYPSVFWASHRGFAVLFCLIILLVHWHILLEFCATGVLYKIISQSNKAATLLNYPFLVFFLSSFGSLVFELSLITVFEYGMGKFLKKLVLYRHYILESSNAGSNAGSQPSFVMPTSHLSGTMQAPMSDAMYEQHQVNGATLVLDQSDGFNKVQQLEYDLDREGSGGGSSHSSYSCYGYLPHILAMIFLFVGGAIKAPLVYECVHVYRFGQGGNYLLLSSALQSIFFVCVWVILWFAFIFKRSWEFKVCHNSNLDNTAGSSTGHRSSTGKLVEGGTLDRNIGPGSPVYACFHDNDGVRAVMLNPQTGAIIPDGSGGTRSVDCCSEDTEASSKQSASGLGNNYVYLHSALPHGGLGMPMMHSPSTAGNTLFYHPSYMSPSLPMPHPQQGLPPIRLLSSIPSAVAEHGDGTNSDSSYGSQNTMTRLSHMPLRTQIVGSASPSPQTGDSRQPTGVLKYAVRRNSFRGSQHSDLTVREVDPNLASEMHFSLSRQDSTRKSNRVTFKEEYEMIPGSSPLIVNGNSIGEENTQSPQVSSNTSSADSGIENQKLIDSTENHSGVVVLGPSKPVLDSEPSVCDPLDQTYQSFNHNYRATLSGSTSTSSAETVRDNNNTLNYYGGGGNGSAATVDYSNGGSVAITFPTSEPLMTTGSRMTGSLQRRGPPLMVTNLRQDLLPEESGNEVLISPEDSEHRLCSQV